MCRPACRIIQTGVRSTFSPRAALKSSGSCSVAAAAACRTVAGRGLLAGPARAAVQLTQASAQSAILCTAIVARWRAVACAVYPATRASIRATTQANPSCSSLLPVRRGKIAERAGISPGGFAGLRLALHEVEGFSALALRVLARKQARLPARSLCCIHHHQAVEHVRIAKILV